MTLLRASTTVGALATVSRVFGYARDILIATVLGAGPVADAFFVAFRLPNLFHRLFAAGPFGSVFVPMLAGRMGQGGQAAGSVFAGEVLAVVVVVSVLFTSALQLAMPWLMFVIAPGFAEDPQRFDLAVTLARIMLFYFLFVLLVLYLGGVLNVLGRFAAAAAMPILLNLFLIVSVFVLAPRLETPAHGLAWGLAAAGVAQFTCLWVACRRAGFPLRLPRPRLTPGVRRLLRATAPAAIGTGAMQINLLVDMAIASLLASGSISYLYYAGRVAWLPSGIVSVAVGTALLPLLSRQFGTGDGKGGVESMNRALEVVLLLTLPGAVVLVLISEPIVATLFERGSFTADATGFTAGALLAFAFGLPAFAADRILGIGFFRARGHGDADESRVRLHCRQSDSRPAFDGADGACRDRACHLDRLLAQCCRAVLPSRPLRALHGGSAIAPPGGPDHCRVPWHGGGLGGGPTRARGWTGCRRMGADRFAGRASRGRFRFVRRVCLSFRCCASPGPCRLSPLSWSVRRRLGFQGSHGVPTAGLF